MFNTIKKYYDKGFYTNEQMKVFVTAEYITEAEYQTITGEAYTV